MRHGKVVAYASTQLKVHDRNYPTHDLDLEVVVFPFKLLMHYLYSVHIDVYTDNRILQYMFTQIKLTLRQRRWLELLKHYNMRVLYHPNKANVIENALSHMTMGSVSHVE